MMIVFDDSFKTGFSEIDSQHKKLFDLANNLEIAMGKGKGRDALSSVFNELVDYTLKHFAYEQKMMEQKAYPMYISHKKEHDTLIQKVQDFIKQFESGNTFLTLDIMNFLKDWLVTHIKDTDKKLGVFLGTHK